MKLGGTQRRVSLIMLVAPGKFWNWPRHGKISPTTQRRRLTNHFDSKWESSDGLQLYAQGWEPEGDVKAAVCLVHGLGEHSGRYGQVAACLTEHGYALLTCDLRGHGKSEGLRGHAPGYEALLEDIDLLLGRAAVRYAGKPRFLYGHSLGGALVISYVLRHKPKIAGVVATSPGLRTAIATPGWKIAIGKLMYRVRPTMLMSNGLDRNGLSHDPAVVRAYNSDPLVHDRVSARLGLDLLNAGEQALVQARDFPLPLLLMHGNADPITSFVASRQFAQAVPAGRCTFQEWDGLYHELHNEPQAGDVLNMLVSWLDAHLPVPPVSAATNQVARIRPGGKKKRR